jgi:hypothetical protein
VDRSGVIVLDSSPSYSLLDWLAPAGFIFPLRGLLFLKKDLTPLILFYLRVASFLAVVDTV